MDSDNLSNIDEGFSMWALVKHVASHRSPTTLDSLAISSPAQTCCDGLPSGSLIGKPDLPRGSRELRTEPASGQGHEPHLFHIGAFHYGTTYPWTPGTTHGRTLGRIYKPEVPLYLNTP
jgi:hypothetical protein